MTDNAPRTDDELAAELLALVEDSPGHTVTLFRSDVRRLIAALRARQAEVADLTKQVTTLKRYRHEFPELEAEVERLREQNDGLYLAVQMAAKEQERLRGERR